MTNIYYVSLFIFLISILSSCARFPKKDIEDKTPLTKSIYKNPYHTKIVTATAYTSRECETDSTPCIAAWNNRLHPNTKSIAVSRDLLKLGLTNGAKVRISGFKGKFKVLDKMNKRWRNRIDIYMGNNLQKALNWGKRKVTISWYSKKRHKPLNSF